MNTMAENKTKKGGCRESGGKSIPTKLSQPKYTMNTSYMYTQTIALENRIPKCCKYNSGRLAVGNYTELLATRAQNELLKYYRMYLEYSTKVPKYIKVS